MGIITKPTSLGTACVVIFLACAVHSHANHFITVTIDGTNVTQTACDRGPLTNPHECLNIAGTHGNLRITPLDSNYNARVEAALDSDNDRVQLVNAKIEATADVSNASIIIERNHTKDPVAPPHWYYKISADGDYDYTDGNYACMVAHVRHDSTGYQTMGSKCDDPVTCDAFGCANTEMDIAPVGTSTEMLVPPNLDAGRTMKMKLSVTLANNSYVNVNLAMLTNSASPDPNGDEVRRIRPKIPFQDIVKMNLLGEILRELSRIGRIPPIPDPTPQRTPRKPTP